MSAADGRGGFGRTADEGLRTDMTTILGISAFYHDSAAALVRDGQILAAAQEERFTRVKHDHNFPQHAVDYCLAEAGIGPDKLDAVCFYDKPLLKFERLLETYLACAPLGLRSFMMAIPLWVRQKLFLPREIDKGLHNQYHGPIYFTQHHQSHAASAFFPSPFEQAAIVTLDGVGEWATTTWGVGQGNRVELKKEIRFPHSIGLLYSAFTYYTGFKVNSGEYKLMGLAPYGNAGSERVQRFKSLILDQLVDLREDGSLLLNMDYFDFATGLTMCRDDKWESLFGVPRRARETLLDQRHMDLALAIQQATEDIVLRLAETAKELTGADYLVMAGGVALNCVANGKLIRRGTLRTSGFSPPPGTPAAPWERPWRVGTSGRGRSARCPIPRWTTWPAPIWGRISAPMKSSGWPGATAPRISTTPIMPI